MPFPVTLDPSVPPDSETPQAGALRIRNLTQAIVDLLGLPVAPTTITSPPFAITDTGAVSFAQGAPGALLSNQTGGTLIAGDVAAISAANDSAVALSDFSGSLAQFVVALGTIAPAATGPFAAQGPIAIVKSQGAIVRGHYVRKSATSLAVEDTGTSEASATPAPSGSLGVAMAASAGPTGTIPVFWLGSTVGSSVSTSGYNARVFRSTNQAIPNNVDTALSFDSTRYNNGPMWALGNPTRLTAPVAGRYLLGANVSFSPTNGTLVKLRVNGTTIIAWQGAPNSGGAGNGTNMAVSTIYALAATDYVEVIVRAQAGVNALFAANYSPEFFGEFLGT